jgi:hypothetical protein
VFLRLVWILTEWIKWQPNNQAEQILCLMERSSEIAQGLHPENSSSSIWRLYFMCGIWYPNRPFHSSSDDTGFSQRRLGFNAGWLHVRCGRTRVFSEFLQFSTRAYYSAIAHTHQLPSSESCCNRKVVSKFGAHLCSCTCPVTEYRLLFITISGNVGKLWTTFVRGGRLHVFTVLNGKSTSLHGACYELSVSRKWRELSLVIQ